jgi:hypothetical protein
MNKTIKINVFGRLLTAEQSERGWTIYYLSGDGKRRIADGIVVPSFITDLELDNYLADLCHEWATEKNPEVRRLNL